MWQVKEYPIAINDFPSERENRGHPIVGLFNYSLNISENHKVLGVSERGTIQVLESTSCEARMDVFFVAVQENAPGIGLHHGSRYLGRFFLKDLREPFYLFLN